MGLVNKILPDCREELGFNDWPLMLVGLPILSLIIPGLFFGIALEDYVEHYLSHPFDMLIFTSIFWVTNRYIIVFLRRRYPLIDQSMMRIVVQILFVLVTTPIIGWILDSGISLMRSMFGFSSFHEPKFFLTIITTYFCCFTIISIYEAVYFFNKYKSALVDNEKIKTLHIQSQLDNLRNQINPHFLFNSLNVLVNLVPENENALGYIDKLSKFYRYSVNKSTDTLTDLESEIENTLIYCDLIKERFGDGIHFELCRAPESPRYIPPLTLQILVENAVNHNIVSKNSPLTVKISLNKHMDRIEVQNNLQKKIQAVKSTGKGVSNIKSRLAFFTDRELQVQETECEFIATVPLVRNKKVVK